VRGPRRVRLGASGHDSTARAADCRGLRPPRSRQVLDRMASTTRVVMTVPVREVFPAGPRVRIVRLDLRGTAFAYAAGQAVLVGAPGAPPRHTYSIASPPHVLHREGWLELLVRTDCPERRDLPFTPATRVVVEGPIGSFTFPPERRARQYVFVAGGTGIAPLRAMLMAAIHLSDARVVLLYSARTPEDFAYGDELRSLAASSLLLVKQTVTRASAPAAWPGTTGRFGRADLLPFVRESSTFWFLCGPLGLIDTMRQHLHDLGVDAGQIKTEDWAAARAWSSTMPR
jgi:ferredoxin-NADP reductase